MLSSDFAALKSYMRVDGDDDNAMVTLASAAAAEFLREAGVPEPVLDNGETLSGSYPLYFLALAGLSLQYYDNRDAVSDGAPALTPLGLQSIIKQLKVSNLDTGETEAT